jgi:hypothetical protein
MDDDWDKEKDEVLQTPAVELRDYDVTWRGTLPPDAATDKLLIEFTDEEGVISISIPRESALRLARSIEVYVGDVGAPRSQTGTPSNG